MEIPGTDRYEENQTNNSAFQIDQKYIQVPICLVAPAPPALELLVNGVPQSVVVHHHTKQYVQPSGSTDYWLIFIRAAVTIVFMIR